MYSNTIANCRGHCVRKKIITLLLFIVFISTVPISDAGFGAVKIRAIQLILFGQFPKRLQTRVRCTINNVTQYSLHFTVQIMDAVINCSVQRMEDFCNVAKTHCLNLQSEVSEVKGIKRNFIGPHWILKKLADTMQLSAIFFIIWGWISQQGNLHCSMSAVLLSILVSRGMPNRLDKWRQFLYCTWISILYCCNYMCFIVFWIRFLNFKEVFYSFIVF